MFELAVTKNRISVTGKESLVVGSSNVYDVHFTFSNDWRNLSEKVVFTIDAEVTIIPLPFYYLKLDDEGMCKIPHQLFDPTWIGCNLLVGVMGSRGSELVLPTVWASLGQIEAGASGDPNAPSLGPDSYQELRDDIGDLVDLETEDKSSLVNAVNEIVDNIEGFGNVKSDQIDSIVVIDREEFEKIPLPLPSGVIYMVRG